MEEFDIPLLNNISDALSITNTDLQLYFDLLHDDNVHDCYSIKHVIINLSACMELLIKFRLLQEHWAFLFDDINKAKECNFDAGNFVSVSFARSIERLRNLCGIESPKYFTASQQLQMYRNRAVHFTLNDNFEAILKTVMSSIVEIKNFACDEVIPYIENDDAIKEIKSQLNELLEFQNDIRIIIAENEVPNLE
jgi:hypothetical protein